MHNYPEITIYKNFSELRRLVDLDRGEAKEEIHRLAEKRKEIDRLADGIIKELNGFESEFKWECKSKINLDYYESKIENMSTKLNKYKNFLNSVGSSDEHRNNSSKEISKAIDALRNEINEYARKENSMDLEVEDIFGKLLVSRNKLFF